MANEPFQTRLADDRAEQVHEYMESRRISKAEAVRRLIVMGLEAHQEEQKTDEDHDTDEADEDRRDRFQVLARLADRALGVGAVLLLVAYLIPVLGFGSVAYTDLTIGTFGVAVIWGLFGIVALGGLAAGITGILTAVWAWSVHSVKAGWVGRRLETYAPTPEDPA